MTATTQTTATIIVDNIQRCQNVKDGIPFDVTYINATDGTSYTAYPSTPGINLVEVGKEIAVQFKSNTYNGRTYRNCSRIMPPQAVPPTQAVPPAQAVPSAKPTPAGQQMIKLLSDIKAMLEKMLQNQEAMLKAYPMPQYPAQQCPDQAPEEEADGLPF